MFKIFLNKIDLRKLELFQYLEQKPQMKESKDKIIEDLNMSDFILNSTIDELNLDFNEHNLLKYYRLDSDKLFVNIVQTGPNTSRKLEIIYAKNSMKFSMLLDIFFKNFTSINEYADLNYVSYSTVYKNLRDLKKICERHDIRINKNMILEGNEDNIRCFIYNYVVQIYNKDYSIYPIFVKNVAKDFFNLLESKLHHPLSESSKIKFFHYMCVTLWRSSNQDYVSEKDKNYIKKSLKFQQLRKGFEEKLAKYMVQSEDKYVKNEATNILLFLIGGEILEGDEYTLYLTDSVLFDLTKKFIKKIKYYYNLDEKTSTSVEDKINLLHFQTLYLKINLNEIYKNLNINYFVENYPE